MRAGKLALINPVTTSTDGRWVAITRWMPVARAKLRQPGDGALGFVGGKHHQVSQLVNENYQVGQLFSPRAASRALYSLTFRQPA